MIFGLTHSSWRYYVVGLKELCNIQVKTEYRQSTVAPLGEVVGCVFFALNLYLL